jgi:sugar lactone lactonase YvrE
MTTPQDGNLHPRSRFAPLINARATLGESPVWCAQGASVRWMNIDGRKLPRTDMTAAAQVWATPKTPGFVQPGAGGAPILGMQRGVFRLDPATGDFALIAPTPQDGVRFNDACLGEGGRICAGTMDLDNRRPVGTLYSLDPCGRLVARQGGFLTINGLAWDRARAAVRVRFPSDHADRPDPCRT